MPGVEKKKKEKKTRDASVLKARLAISFSLAPLWLEKISEGLSITIQQMTGVLCREWVFKALREVWFLQLLSAHLLHVSVSSEFFRLALCISDSAWHGDTLCDGAAVWRACVTASRDWMEPADLDVPRPRDPCQRKAPCTVTGKGRKETVTC